MNIRGNTSSPNYNGEFPILEGLTQSHILFKDSVSYMNTEQGSQACLAIQSVNITVSYKPTIYISSNIAYGGCRYEETMAHEHKHVVADIGTINEFLPDMRKAAVSALVHAQTTRPVNKSQLHEAEDYATDKLSDAITRVINDLDKTRAERQRRIDSRAEYMRLSRACPTEPVR